MADAIKIDGLTQFSKAIKEIDTGLPKMLRLALNQSADLVVTGARPKVPSNTGRAKGSIKAASAQDKVRIKAGGPKAPWYPWLDYGGEGRRKGRPTHRPFIKSGRYLYPVYFAKRDSGEFQTIMQTALDEVVKAAGLEVD
jgi:hypothetical protein